MLSDVDQNLADRPVDERLDVDGAKNVWISIVERRRVLHTRIRDDGRGFRMRPRPRASTHIGIETAGERVRAMTGTFDVVSVVGEGTTVEFHLPVPDGASGPRNPEIVSTSPG